MDKRCWAVGVLWSLSLLAGCSNESSAAIIRERPGDVPLAAPQPSAPPAQPPATEPTPAPPEGPAQPAPAPTEAAPAQKPPDLDPSYFCNAAAAGDLAAVQKLLAAGMDVNAVDESTKSRPTALINAAKFNHGDIVELLLSRGARPDVRDGSGKTAFDWARDKGLHRIAARIGTALAMAEANPQKKRGSKPAFLLPVGDACVASYQKVEGVCAHESLLQKPELLVLIDGYKRGAAPPMVP